MQSTFLMDAEIVTFRLAYYRLFVRWWWQEPLAASIATLRDGMDERLMAAAQLHPLLGEGWQVIAQYLKAQAPEEVAAEYTQLFIGPHGPIIQPYESYYLTGALFRAPLVALHGFLKHLGIVKRDDEYHEPEDVLAFELDVMRWLIERQQQAARQQEEAHWLQQQVQLLQRHLLIWAPACAYDIEQSDKACFYRGAAMILRGFLELERDLFRSYGLDQVASLSEARQRYGANVVWQGPVVTTENEC